MRPFALLGFLLLSASSVGAQVYVGSTEKPRADRGGRDDAPRTPAGPTATRLTVAGIPRSYQVLRVDVPAELPALQPVHYRARSLGTASLISRAEGDLAPAESRGISVVIGIPARARAGRIPAAEVTFTTPTGQLATIVVDMEVTLVRSVAMDVLRPSFGARPGQQLRIPYQVFNRGNARDTVSLHVDVPWGWTATAGADTTGLVLEAGAAVQRELVARVSRMSSAGSYGLRFHVRGDSADLSTDMATVDVVGPISRTSGDGLALSTSFGIASGANGGKTAIAQYGLGGPIVGKLSMQMDVSTATSLDARNRYRLSSLGQLPQPPNFALFTPTWRASAGAVGFSYSEILGMGVGGRGGSYSYEGSRFSGQALVAKVSSMGGDSAPPANFAVRLGTRLGTNWITGTALRMHDGGASARELQVIGAGLLAPHALGGQITSELAFRKYGTGSGMGLLGDYTRVAGPEDRMQVRASYAPGGTNAFAIARSNVNAVLTRRAGSRTLLNAQAWYTDDGGEGLQTHSFGATVTPQVQVSKSDVISLEGGTRFQSYGTKGTSFGMSEHRLDGSYRWGGLGLSYTAGAGGALVSRTVGLDTLLEVRRSSLRTRLFGDVTKGTVRFGSWMLSGSFSNDESNLTTLPREARLGAGFSQFPIYFYGGFNLRFTGLVEHVSWMGARPGAVAYHGDVTADLPFGFIAGWSMDRRPFEAIPGAGSWATSLRISRRGAFSLPTPFRRGNRSGVVYQDLNGNGLRDHDEPGIGGIMVLRGSERISTDEQGEFHFAAPKSGNVPGTLRLEPRSLPPGWLERPIPMEQSKAAKVKDIGLIPMANVRVIVEVSREDLGASGALDLSKVVVTARDSAGRLWLAAREPSGSQVFPALPPGRYKLDVDPSALGVPLTLKEDPPAFDVGQSRDARTIRVELATRKVRMFRAGSAQPKPSAPAQSLPAAAP